MNVAFLDIDGVLNSVRSHIAFFHLSRLDKVMDADWWIRNTKVNIDPVAVGLFNKLMRDFDGRIVLSSSKRREVDNGPNKLSELKRFLNEIGVEGDRLIGWTPLLNKDEHERGHEVKHWLDNNSGVTQYIIIDDYDEQFLPEQLGRFIHVNQSIGFSELDYRRATALFGKEDFGQVFL